MVMVKEILYERRPYIFVEQFWVNKINKSMRDLIFGKMVVHKRENK